jgi:uncharacterized protein (UPF0332 family)
MSLSADLVEQAEKLARLDPKRPKSANVRRAISSAYYALFHHLIGESTQLLLGTTDADWPLAALAARAFNHGDLKNACGQFTKTTPVDVLKTHWLKLGVAANADLRVVAEEFIALQELRHAADYDLTRTFTRTEALDAVGRSRDAMAAWGRLKQANRELARLAAVVMLLYKNLQGR